MTDSSLPPIQLGKFWPYKAVFLADRISRHTLSILRETTKLNLSQWRVLAAVAEQPGRTATDVTNITPMDKTLVSRAVQLLIQSQLIEKIPDKDDKRRMTLRSTEKGYAVYQEIAEKLRSSLTPKSEETEDSQELLRLLDLFIERLPDPHSQDKQT